MILEIPFIRKVVEKWDDISIDKIIKIEDLCRRIGIKVENGLGKEFYPPYLMVFSKCYHYIGTGYDSHFRFNENPDHDFAKGNQDILDVLNNGLHMIYNDNVMNFSLWKK